MTAFIAEHKENFGVEPMCAVLPIASSTYHAHLSRPPSARKLRDEALKPEITRVYQANHSVYGPRKVWRQLKRDRCRVSPAPNEVQVSPSWSIAGSRLLPPARPRRVSLPPSN